MELLTILGCLAAGIVIGVIAVWLLLQSKLNESRQSAKGLQMALDSKAQLQLDSQKSSDDKTQRIDQLTTQNTSLQNDLAALNARLISEQKSADEKIALIEQSKQILSDTFKSLAAESLNQNNQAFLQIAGVTFSSKQQAIDDLVKPLALSLASLGEQLQSTEKARAEAHGSLSQHLTLMRAGQEQLTTETSYLGTALRTPHVRGKWGELSLQRVAELAGMSNHCDFISQATIESEEGKVIRPDMLINLPNNRRIAVDSKASMSAYLDSLTATDDNARRSKLKEHGAQVKDHINKLNKKDYWAKIEGNAEFTILFLPGEMFYSAALEHGDDLLAYAASKDILLASPTNLIALLKVIEMSWREKQVSENAELIRAAASELYDRTAVVISHLNALGRALDTTTQCYSKAVGEIEGKFIRQAKLIKEMGATGKKELEKPKKLRNKLKEIKQTTLDIIPEGFTSETFADIPVTESEEIEAEAVENEPEPEIVSPVPQTD